MAHKWYQKAVNENPPNDLNNWHKNQGALTRKRNALSSRPKNWSLDKRYLSAARALQALANVTKDMKTRRIAEADAQYFFMKTKVNN